ncbi:MAG TPA: hypothetical protein EYH30_05130 [Anaerolineales bacterium]|nr:hypothetical protein [Anaerolineales bacterium]
MLAVVLAAGRGKRLRPLTDARSKPMLPVAGKPMVERVMEQLAAEGVERFVVVVHPGDGPLLSLLRRPPWRGRVRVILQEVRRAHRLDGALTLLRVRPEEAPTLAVVRMEGERVTGIVVNIELSL